MERKGLNLGDLYPLVITIIIIGIVLGIGLFVLGETAEAVSTNVITVANETIGIEALATLSPIAVATATECGFNDFKVLTVTNATESDGLVFTVGNYTVSADAGTILNATSEYPGDWNVSYTYRGSGDDTYCTSLTTTTTGLGGLASWIAVLVVVLAAAVVLGVVINSFGRTTGA